MTKGKLQPMTGKKFGKLTVMERGPDFECESGDKRVQWWVDCDKCNGAFLVVARNVERQKTMKCKECGYKGTKKVTYWTKKKLLKRHIFEPDAIENEGVFGLDHYFLAVKNGMDSLAIQLNGDISSFIIGMFKKIDGKYILQNHPDPIVMKQNPKLSHDQITFTCAFSIATNKDYHRVIKDQMGWFPWYSYDGRFLHPRDVLFIKACNSTGKKRERYCRWLVPIMKFTFSRSHTTRKGVKIRKTSEPRMWFTRTEALNVHWFTELYQELCKREFGSVKGVFVAYYKEAPHPNLSFNKYE